MYIFSQDSLNMQVVKHINQLNDIPVFIILCYSIIQLYKQISYKRLVVYILTYLLVLFLLTVLIKWAGLWNLHSFLCMSASMNEGGGFVNVDVNAYLKNTIYI